jgi:hypothetical protein
MELHAIPYGSEPPIAATFELSENSRLGLTIKNVALHPRFEACNSNTLLGLPQACFKIASGNTVVLNNPLSFTDPSGQDGGLVLCAGGPVACAAGVAVTAIFDWKFFESLFGGPSFHGSLKPRPNSQPWDEHNIMYGPNIAGALGLPDAGCDFGACGDISSGFQQQGPSANSQVLLPLLPPLFLLKFRDLYPWNWGGGDSNLVPGTHYCGPGGWGQPTGQVDIACQAHDLCYNNLRINAAMNVLGLVPNSAKAGQTACDQQLCNAISGSRLNQQEMGQALAVQSYFNCH